MKFPIYGNMKKIQPTNQYILLLLLYIYIFQLLTMAHMKRTSDHQPRWHGNAWTIFAPPLATTQKQSICKTNQEGNCIQQQWRRWACLPLFTPPKWSWNIWNHHKSSRICSLSMFNPYGYGSIPINTIFRGMNIHLPAILIFTRGTRFWHTVIFEWYLTYIHWNL